MCHAQICEQAADNDQVSTLLKWFVGSPTESSPTYQSWYRSIEDERNQLGRNGYHNKEILKVDDLTPASIASFVICAFGFYTLISPWWDNPWDTYKHKNMFHHSLLEFAVLGKSPAICARLISWAQRWMSSPDILTMAVYWCLRPVRVIAGWYKCFSSPGQVSMRCLELRDIVDQ